MPSRTTTNGRIARVAHKKRIPPRYSWLTLSRSSVTAPVLVTARTAGGGDAADVDAASVALRRLVGV
jgi:hypothetical protein